MSGSVSGSGAACESGLADASLWLNGLGTERTNAAPHPFYFNRPRSVTGDAVA